MWTFEERIRRAIEDRRPVEMALLFNDFVGLFYGRDRRSFDRLARWVARAYAADSHRKAERFRTRLDQRLRNRRFEPVAWEDVADGYR